eukprot:m.34839 g.34839  ORF g.34839 m.34839 type:complete len:56 (-) comp11067_c0_seq1:502-669(-)
MFFSTTVCCLLLSAENTRMTYAIKMLKIIVRQSQLYVIVRKLQEPAFEDGKRSPT